MALSREERKAWARESFVGLQKHIVPSFTPHPLELDEAGMFDHFLNCRFDETVQLYRHFVKTNTLSFSGGNGGPLRRPVKLRSLPVQLAST